MALSSVLVVEDDAALRAVIQRGLPQVDVRLAASLDEARGLLQPLPDVVLTDVNLVGESGIAFTRELHEQYPRLPVVVMTAFGDLKLAIEALRAGAYDFLTKPLDFGLLLSALERAAEAHQLRREVRELRRQVRMSRGLGELIGECEPMQGVFRLIQTVANAPSSVLIRGESGTGKELVAKALHNHSARRAGPFVAVNCAAIPENLLESELFGHVKGAFTDAQGPRQGLMQRADKGTLFLDEIGDLPLAMQAKLLRSLQERSIRPVGADRDTPIDIRVVAATNIDLEQAVDERRFRQDLLYRLDVIGIDLPPLRERGRDVLLLAQRFVQHFAQQMGKSVHGISPQAARQLLHYSWPGNVRELQNCMERAVVLSTYDEIQREDLPRRVAEAEIDTELLGSTSDPAAMVPLAVIERRYIEQVLAAVGGRRSEAARILEVDRKTLYRKLERWRHETDPD